MANLPQGGGKRANGKNWSSEQAKRAAKRKTFAA
jgi:hypothetical protein